MTVEELGKHLANDEQFMANVMSAGMIARAALERVAREKREVIEDAPATYSPDAQPGAGNSHTARSARKAA